MSKRPKDMTNEEIAALPVFERIGARTEIDPKTGKKVVYPVIRPASVTSFAKDDIMWWTDGSGQSWFFQTDCDGNWQRVALNI